MKKINIMLLLIIILGLFSCKNETEEENKTTLSGDITIKSIIIDSQVERINIVVSFVPNSENMDFDKIGINISYKETTYYSITALPTYEYNTDYLSSKSEYIFYFNEDIEENYKDIINVIAYYTYIDDDASIKKFTSNIKTLSLLDLALNNEGALSRKILEANRELVTKMIYIELNTSKYTVVAKDNTYTASLESSPDYMYIIITITLNVEETYDFLEVYVNNILLESNKYIILDNVITYTINDPNWTKPY